MALLDEIAGYMEAQSTAFTKLAGSAGNLARGFMPDASPAPDTIVALYETGGSAPVHTFSTGTANTRYFEQPRVQIIARSSDYPTAHNLISKAFTLLDGVANQDLASTGGSRYIDITAVQSPFSIGRDANSRFLMSVNFDVLKLVSGVVGDPGAFDSGFTGGFA